MCSGRTLRSLSWVRRLGSRSSDCGDRFSGCDNARNFHLGCDGAYGTAPMSPLPLPADATPGISISDATEADGTATMSPLPLSCGCDISHGDATRWACRRFPFSCGCDISGQGSAWRLSSCGRDFSSRETHSVRNRNHRFNFRLIDSSSYRR
jgi:hypothetical protein